MNKLGVVSAGQANFVPGSGGSDSCFFKTGIRFLLDLDDEAAAVEPLDTCGIFDKPEDYHKYSNKYPCKSMEKEKKNP